MKRTWILLVVIILMACSGVSGPVGRVSPQPEGSVAAASTAVVVTPTDSVPTLVQISEAGCCASPEWSADGALVVVIDKPGEVDPAGMYGIPADGRPARLVSAQVGLFSADGKYLAFVDEKEQTVIREVASGADHVLDNHGQRPWISPNDTHVAWVMGTNIDAVIGTRVDVYVSDIDGANQRALITVYNGGIAGWLDEDRLLIAGRKAASPGNIDLFSLNVASGAIVDIASETRIREVSIAPGGRWVNYAVTFDTAEPPDDGLWVVSADGLIKYKLDVAGPAQWRDDHRLVVIPMEMGASSYRLYQLDALTGHQGDITDPAITSFKVAGGQWRVSPDGTRMVFLNAVDRALWVMRLPE